MTNEPRDDTEARQVRPFADFLQDQAGGSTHAELSEQLRDLVEAVKATGKKGSLRLDISVATVGNQHSALSVTARVSCKQPSSDPASSIFFVDSDGNLRRENPAQPRLPLTAVAPAGIDPDTGEITRKEAN